MANSPKGRPADFNNLSPFAGSKKNAADSGSQGFLILGAVGILAVLALVFFALILKAS